MVMIINTKIGAPDMTASFRGANDRILTKLIMRFGERIYKIKITIPSKNPTTVDRAAPAIPISVNFNNM